jgi:hypothetical protein
MRRHRNPQGRVPKPARADNFHHSAAIEILHNELVEVEALAVAAMMLATSPPATQRRSFVRIYTLIRKTARQAGEALDKSEHLVARLSAYMLAQAANRPQASRSR